MASFFNVEILNSFNPELQLKDTEPAIKDKFKKLFKFVTTLVVMLKKIESEDKTKYTTFYSNTKAETIINENDIDDLFQSVYTTIISNTQKS